MCFVTMCADRHSIVKKRLPMLLSATRWAFWCLLFWNDRMGSFSPEEWDGRSCASAGRPRKLRMPDR